MLYQKRLQAPQLPSFIFTNTDQGAPQATQAWPQRPANGRRWRLFVRIADCSVAKLGKLDLSRMLVKPAPCSPAACRSNLVACQIWATYLACQELGKVWHAFKEDYKSIVKVLSLYCDSVTFLYFRTLVWSEPRHRIMIWRPSKSKLSGLHIAKDARSRMDTSFLKECRIIRTINYGASSRRHKSGGAIGVSMHLRKQRPKLQLPEHRGTLNTFSS